MGEAGDPLRDEQVRPIRDASGHRSDSHLVRIVLLHARRWTSPGRPSHRLLLSEVLAIPLLLLNELLLLSLTLVNLLLRCHALRWVGRSSHRRSLLLVEVHPLRDRSRLLRSHVRRRLLT